MMASSIASNFLSPDKIFQEKIIYNYYIIIYLYEIFIQEVCVGGGGGGGYFLTRGDLP